MKNYTLYVSGTHCPACKILIEDILGEEKNIHNVNVDLRNETVTLDADDGTIQTLAQDLSLKIKPHGYTLSTEKQTVVNQDKRELLYAIPLGILALGLFILIQKSGIVNLGVGGSITPTTSFLIGLIASVSSCLAVVGGLVLSLSATVSKDNMDNKKPIILFHGGRLISFGILGGVLGFIGHAIGINYMVSAILGLLAAIVMILLGLNLIGIFKRAVLTLPSSLFTFFRNAEHRAWAPLIVGFGTFFLPCGFTQSMQIAALSSGSLVMGALIMFAFALGTLPMLALLSFGAASFAQSKHAPLFFKSSGVFVLGLGLIGFVTGLAGMGVIPPLLSL